MIKLFDFIKKHIFTFRIKVYPEDKNIFWHKIIIVLIKENKNTVEKNTEVFILNTDVFLTFLEMTNNFL